MKSSVIEHPNKDPFVIIRSWQVKVCAPLGKTASCAAGILSLFEYWHNANLSKNKTASRQDLMIESSLNNIIDNLNNLWSINTVRKALGFLYLENFIDRIGEERQKNQFYLNVQRVNEFSICIKSDTELPYLYHNICIKNDTGKMITTNETVSKLTQSYIKVDTESVSKVIQAVSNLIQYTNDNTNDKYNDNTQIEKMCVNDPKITNEDLKDFDEQVTKIELAKQMAKQVMLDDDKNKNLETVSSILDEKHNEKETWNLLEQMKNSFSKFQRKFFKDKNFIPYPWIYRDNTPNMKGINSLRSIILSIETYLESIGSEVTDENVFDFFKTTLLQIQKNKNLSWYRQNFNPQTLDKNFDKLINKINYGKESKSIISASTISESINILKAEGY